MCLLTYRTTLQQLMAIAAGLKFNKKNEKKYGVRPQCRDHICLFNQGGKPALENVMVQEDSPNANIIYTHKLI